MFVNLTFLWILFCTSFAFSSEVFDSPPSHREEHSPSAPMAAGTDRLDQVIQYINGTITDEIDMASLMRQHYQRFRLIRSDDNTWEPAFKHLESELLPPLSASNFHAFLGYIGEYVRQNPYLLKAINSMGHHDFIQIQEKIRREGAQTLPDIISYAMVLEKLTSTFMCDITLLDSLDVILERSKKDISVYKYCSLFELFKYYTLRHISGTKNAIKTGNPSANFIRYGLPLNILEAVCSDFCKGNFQNAYTGWCLMRNPPGGKLNRATGSGPAYVDRTNQDHPILHVRPPLPKQWADLYTTWNLAFVSSYPNSPYFMAKLLIPSVAGYTQNPTQYIHGRIISLYLHINFELFQRVDGKSLPASMGWNSKEFTQAFGRTNLLSARNYQLAVNQASPSLYTRAKSKIGSFFSCIFSLCKRGRA
jgi:hypothetical protein